MAQIQLLVLVPLAVVAVTASVHFLIRAQFPWWITMELLAKALILFAFFAQFALVNSAASFEALAKQQHERALQEEIKAAIGELTANNAKNHKRTQEEVLSLYRLVLRHSVYEGRGIPKEIEDMFSQIKEIDQEWLKTWDALERVRQSQTQPFGDNSGMIDIMQEMVDEQRNEIDLKYIIVFGWGSLFLLLARAFEFREFHFRKVRKRSRLSVRTIHQMRLRTIHTR